MARTTARATRKASNVISIDFSGVETNSVVPEGEYIVRVVEAKKEDSDKNEQGYIAWNTKIRDGKYAGKTLYNNTSLAPQSLWATKRFIECLGITVPDGEFELDLDEVVDMELGVVVEHEVYKGRTRSRIIDTFPLEGETEGATEGEAAASGAEFPSKDEIMEMGKADLAELVKEHGLDVELEGTTSAQRRAVLKAIEEAGTGGDEQEEEAAEESANPTTGKATKKAAPKKVTYTPDEVNELDEDGLAEVIEKHELDVDLDEHKTLRRKRSAVIDALEGAELLVEE